MTDKAGGKRNPVTIEMENHIGFDVLANTDPLRVQFDGSLSVETWATYDNAAYDFTEWLSLKAGARYSWEKGHLRNNTAIGSAALNQVVRDPLQWDHGKTWSEFSPSLGFEVRLDRNWLFYGNWSRGFKSGAAEIGLTRRTALDPPLPFVGPEKVEAFELGTKYAAGTLSFNLAAFFQRPKNGHHTPPQRATEANGYVS